MPYSPSSIERHAQKPTLQTIWRADFERLSVQQVPRRQKISGRLWKRELQKLANELGLDIVVSHLPPGTSKWNKIEHRFFSFISQNWRAQPLVSYRVIVELISATTTKTGLTVCCELDTGLYPSGIVDAGERRRPDGRGDGRIGAGDRRDHRRQPARGAA